MRVWVTRAEPGASETAERLRRLGCEPVVRPVLAVRPLDPPLDLHGVAALAFTSRNGVDAFAARSPARDVPALCVGDATAEVARRAGFADVRSAAGDVEALAALIASLGFDGVVLHAGAREPAGDLAGALAAAGVRARAVALYETVPVEGPAPSADAVLVHSPKAARLLASRLDPAEAPPVACLSAAAARPLAEVGFARVVAAPFPDEAALLKLLSEPPFVREREPQ